MAEALARLDIQLEEAEKKTIANWMRESDVRPSQIRTRFGWLNVSNGTEENNQPPDSDPATSRFGMLMVFIRWARVDKKWEIVKLPTINGELGFISLVRTMKPMGRPSDGNPTKPICVLIRDYNDTEDMARVKKRLVELGFNETEIHSKTDQDEIHKMLHGGRRFPGDAWD